MTNSITFIYVLINKMNEPINKSLYNRIKTEAKLRFKVWPSAYASGWLVKEYKRRGGKYTGKKSSSSGLTRWFDEQWINVCKLPKKVVCGRPQTSIKQWTKQYPYCRPSKRITKKTPKTSSELSSAELKSRCKKKRRSPLNRLSPRKSPSRKSPSRKSRRRKSRR